MNIHTKKEALVRMLVKASKAWRMLYANGTFLRPGLRRLSSNNLILLEFAIVNIDENRLIPIRIKRTTCVHDSLIEGKTWLQSTETQEY